jgi:HPt (histidine-containing phosphotransfer) domain-containing protein
VTEQHLDSTVLANLREVMESQYPDLLAAFLLDSRERLQALHAALDIGDAEALRRAAHSFKGSCSNMGASRLACLCEELESLAHSRQLAGTESLLASVEAEFTIVRAEFLDQIRRYDSHI